MTHNKQNVTERQKDGGTADSEANTIYNEAIYKGA